MEARNDAKPLKFPLEELDLSYTPFGIWKLSEFVNSRSRLKETAVYGNRCCRFFRLEEVLYDGEMPTREAWKNFVSAIHVSGMNFIYVIRGDAQGTHIYLGLAAKPGTPEALRLGDYAQDIVASSFQGMFRGSRLTPLRENDMDAEIFTPAKRKQYVNVVTGIPSWQNEKKKEGILDYQGMDRLISAMHGENWQMIVVCEPLERAEVAGLREEIYGIYDHLSILAKSSLQSSHSTTKGDSYGTGTGKSHTVGEADSSGRTRTEGTGTSKGQTETSSASHSTNEGESVAASHTTGKTASHSDTMGENRSIQKSQGQSSGTSKGKSASHSSSRRDYDDDSETHGTTDSSNKQSGTSSSTSDSQGTSRSHGETVGTSESDTQGKTRNTGTSETESKSRSVQQTDTVNRSRSESDTHSTNFSDTESYNSNSSHSDSDGRSITASVDVVNKKAAEFLKYIDETLLPRLAVGSNRGMFKTAVYLLTETKSVNARLSNNVTAIFQGESNAFTPLTVSEALPNGSYVCDWKIHRLDDGKEWPYRALYGTVGQDHFIDLATCLNSDEVGLIAGLPRSEVPGVALRRYVSFGLNPAYAQQETMEPLYLGELVYGGKILVGNHVSLDKKSLNKHIFVTGITGSGKTVTCKRLLRSAAVPFLVIEPAKTEYQELLLESGMEDVVVFTIGTESGLPFRFNPFELLPGENFTAHIDLVKAAFMSSFHFEASMPQIFEIAMYRVYKEWGWDTDTGEYMGRTKDNWPTLTAFIKQLEEVVKEQKFGPELEGNYRGSLISRIANLTYGAKGKMLNCSRSIDFEKLLKSKVVIEMEDLKSPQDKALIMALVMGRLNEAVKQTYRNDKKFRHITLIEEAHRLLSKVLPGDDEGKKYSVSMFTDMLAEIRKYGESLIIVDQIPNKLAEDVLKNTATKIVHKLVAKDDKEAIGDTMMLEDEQKTFLSNLLTGRAIVFTENWHKPVCVQVEAAKQDRRGDDITKRMADMEMETTYQYYYAYHPELPPGLSRDEYHDYRARGYKAYPIIKKLFGGWVKADKATKQRLLDGLPSDSCLDEGEAKVILAALIANSSRMPKLGDYENAYIEAILDAVRSRDYEAFASKHGDDLRFLAGYL